ncbi:hypothetical protein HJD18_16185 [Thermoleophilia bacterium SCSIO 60948]|nr:hypothetical protein HJD18_16185 [Thermoleophilia bacterium SCSIO 60948]
MSIAIEIRNAVDSDLPALRRLAERDTAPIPTGELLLAIESGEVLAARSASGEVIADPFAPTAALVATLEAAANPSPGRRARPSRTAPIRPGLAR